MSGVKNTALFERLMEIHSNSPKLYYGFKGLSHSIVLVDLNEFPSIFQKVQHSHSRHQKTSTFLRINFKDILKFNEIWPLEGATCMYIPLW